jgi:hypothetical protein
MARSQIVVLGGSGIVIAEDSAATASTVVMRDSSGNVIGASLQGSDLNSTGTLTLAGSATKTTTFTFDTSAVVWLVDAAGGTFAGTLPAAATCSGRVYIIVKITTSNTFTLTGNGAETINNAGTSANTLAMTSGSVHAVRSNGTGWNVIW